MIKRETIQTNNEALEKELVELRHQLEEARETIEAIRTGQIDALVVQGNNGHQLYTLKSADQTYRFFIENMAEGAVTINSQGIVLYSNSRFAKMANRPLSRVIGFPFEDFISTESLPFYKKLFEKSWHSECKGEVNLIDGGRPIPVQLSLTTIDIEKEVSLSIILTDLTAQKNTQKQLRSNNEKLEEINLALELSNHDLHQFASIASHDLQEPLRKIQIFSSLMKDKENELAPDLRKYLDKIVDSSGRMKNLIVDILNYSRLSANITRIENIDLNELVNEIIEDFELIISEKKAIIQVNELPKLNAKRGQVRQVFQNIISNALKFSKPGETPLIEIFSKRINNKSFDAEENSTGPFCLISIKDNGIGFDEKYVSNIFDLFERLHSKDKYEGTGIGLAIAKKIIEKHQGLITATSKTGNGAEFKIILPISQSQPEGF